MENKQTTSDARPTPPSFDEMVELIKKLFIEYLEDVIKSPPSEIAKSWERYKVLNHLWQDEATKASAVWRKGAKDFPIAKPVVAKMYVKYMGKEIIGTASSATGEMICFDWNVSSVCFALDHEELNNLTWLDESL